MVPSQLSVETIRLGPLPIVNHFVHRLGLDSFLDAVVPTTDRRVAVPYAKALGVLLRSILVEREPIYRQQETVLAFGAEAFGLAAAEAKHLGDDRIGRALDRLFDADRASLLTSLAIETVRRFDLKTDELHGDSTTAKLCGAYRSARGRSVRGKRALFITNGHSKDHRPDLKQVLFEMSITTDGGVPLRFRCADGNMNDDLFHIAAWDTLCAIAGKRDFLYVADAKLCSQDNMMHIHRNRGRFVTVIPRNRLEHKQFVEWIRTHEPRWTEVWNRPNPRCKNGPRDMWRVFRSPMPSREGWPITWVHSSLLEIAHAESRRSRIAKAVKELDAVEATLRGSRPRIRHRHDLGKRADGILKHYQVSQYVKVFPADVCEDRYVKDRGGPPGPRPRFKRVPKMKLSLTWNVDDEAVRRDAKMDGIYPLLTNDTELAAEAVLAAHKAQPQIEKRFEQLKSVFQVAPVCLKNEARIEALLTIFFIAMLVQALIEREVRRAMRRNGIDALPLYPEGRNCKRPTAEQILGLFAHVQRCHIIDGGRVLTTQEPEFTDMQRRMLRLLGVPLSAYWSRA
jgi:transposase